MTCLIPLSELAPSQEALVGAKAARLSQLLKAGFPVPLGACIPASDITLVDRPPDEAQILQQLAGLGSLFAVRSSACEEDGAEASFAGILLSFLNVPLDDTFWPAVVQSSASGTTARARAYMPAPSREGRPGNPVLVQRMVPARCSGVAFSADPLTGESRIVIEGGEGVGQGVSVGSGQTFRCMVERPGGGASYSDPNLKSILSDQEIREVCTLAYRAHEFMQTPVDIEWAFDDRQLWLLQARAIQSSSIKARLELLAGARKLLTGSGTKWSRAGLGARLPEPTPLTWSLWQPMMTGSGILGSIYRMLGFQPDEAANNRCGYDLILGRIYCNDHWHSRIQDRVQALLAPEEPKSQPSPQELLGLLYRQLRSPWRVARLRYRYPKLAVIANVELGQMNPISNDKESLRSALDARWRWLQGAGGLVYLLPGAVVAHITSKRTGPILNRLPQQVEAAASAPYFPGSPELELASRPNDTGCAPHLSTGVSFAPQPRPAGGNLATWLAYRQWGRQCWLAVHAQVKAILVQLGQHFGIGDGIFYLRKEELADLFDGRDVHARIASRWRERMLALGIPVPSTISCKELDKLGRQVETGGDRMLGLGISPGVASAPAWLVEGVPGDPPASPFILIASETDPSWLPVIKGCRGLILERGGVLSHGAIVARELGLPAVSELPGIGRRIRPGQLVRIDGLAGTVEVLVASSGDPRN